MWVEITKQAFQALVTSDLKTSKVEEQGFFRSTEYHNLGVRLVAIESFLSGTTQYFIYDINH